ncbi:hypothetical protein GCM10027429_08410 [Marivirga atlantica]|jgi:hypothetical protein|uniref:Lipoprotein n=1 Tax=Marivirga atlantica TaxID=1548457 RepID=A0A937DIR2_9BACT|nr:hypothetical protein [Marivirga atlantica]MBL0764451.1 hypothetical protein [Marivirga atlantica]
MRSLLIIVLVFLLVACSDKPESFLPNEKFNSIFENPSEGVNYEPLDIIQTEDNGYLILAESALDAVFIMKITSLGQLAWSTTMPATFENPVADLIFNEGKYYFIASTQADQTATLIEVDDFNQSVTPTQRTYVGYRNPLAFGRMNPENFLLLNYNDTTGPVLSKIQSGFGQEWARRYDSTAIEIDAIDEIRNNTSANFFVGGFDNGENTYFHSLRTNGYALTFTDEQGIETGKVSGTSEDKVISYAYLGNQAGAINYVVNGNSFFQLAMPLQNNDSISLNQVGGESLIDKTENDNAQIINTEVVATANIINLYGTVDGRIKWTNYAVGSGSIQQIDYVGGNDPLKVKKAIGTRDGGIAILAKITIAGSRERIAVQKIPREELLGIN